MLARLTSSGNVKGDRFKGLGLVVHTLSSCRNDFEHPPFRKTEARCRFRGYASP